MPDLSRRSARLGLGAKEEDLGVNQRFLRGDSKFRRARFPHLHVNRWNIR